MGCLSQKQNKNISKTRLSVNNKQDLVFKNVDMVGQIQGNISHHYCFYNPPLALGHYADVYRALHKKTKQQRAIKVFRKEKLSTKTLEILARQVQIMKKLVNSFNQDHPNIVKVFEYFQNDKHFYIVTELLTGGQLFEKIAELKTFNQARAAQIIKDILSAVCYCHSKGIVHRDIKPQNILYQTDHHQSNLKIIDFGISLELNSGEELNQKVGTPYYIAPQVIKKAYKQKCDIWSCGIILYILLTGYPPFEGETTDEIYTRILNTQCHLNVPQLRDISEEAKDLIKHMLIKDQQKRYSANDCLQHKWFKNFKSQTQISQNNLIESLRNLKTFRVTFCYQTSAKLQEASWLYIVSNIATKQQKQKLMADFKTIDTNSDGFLSRDQLIQAYSKVFGKQLNNVQQQVDQILSAAHQKQQKRLDYTGTLVITDFIKATIDRQNLLSRQRLQLAFNALDLDGNGEISIQQIKSLFKGKKVQQKVWNEVIMQVDQNNDGVVIKQ